MQQYLKKLAPDVTIAPNINNAINRYLPDWIVWSHDDGMLACIFQGCGSWLVQENSSKFVSVKTIRTFLEPAHYNGEAML